MGFPCISFVAFPLLLLTYSMSLIFVSLINMCLSMSLLRFILYGTLCTSWTWVFAFHLGKLLAIISSNIFSCPFFSLFSFLDHYNVNAGVFNVMREVFEAVLTSFHSFSFILFCGSDFHQSICFPAHLLILLPHLLCYWFLLGIFHLSYYIFHLCLLVL